MNTKTMLSTAALLTGLVVFSAEAGSFNQPSSDWNSNWGFRGPSQQQVDLNRADMIERKDGGYYDQWNVHQTYHVNAPHTTYSYGDHYADDTYVGTQVNNTAIGQQFHNDCEGTNVDCSNTGDNNDDVTADQTFTNSNIEGDADNNGQQTNQVVDVNGDLNYGGNYGN